MELARFERAAVVRPKRPDDVLVPLTIIDPLDHGLPVAVPTVGAAVGGDRTVVPGPTVGICHAVPLGKMVIGTADVLLVPYVTTLEVTKGMVRAVTELITVVGQVSTMVEALADTPARAHHGRTFGSTR